MNYVIFDLEWNQPSVETATAIGSTILTGEIIEIGAVKLDDAFDVVDEKKMYIKPQFYTKMHHRIASLTGIHDRDLQEKGLPFLEAFAQFQHWCGENFSYMTWSMSDLPVLVDNMVLHGMDISNLPVCYDIQRIFGREIMRKSKRYSLDTALAILREKGETAHDALNDARNTAKVCRHLDFDVYLDEYEARVFVPEPFCGVYETYAEVLSSTQLSMFRCPWCGESIAAEPWVIWDPKTIAAMGSCAEGDEFLLLLTVGQTYTGIYYAKRLAYEMSADFWEQYQEKKESGNFPPKIHRG